MNPVVNPPANPPVNLIEKRPLSSLWGLFPLGFFLAQLVHHYLASAPANIFWMCNISNLTLALGLFFHQQKIVAISTLWLLFGIPLWVIDLIEFHQTPLSTFLAHIGGVTIALYTYRHSVKIDRVWYWALIWFLLVQAFCRIFTGSNLNINLAHQIRGTSYFGHYWQFWISMILVIATMLFLLETVLQWIFKGILADRSIRDQIPSINKVPADNRSIDKDQ